MPSNQSTDGPTDGFVRIVITLKGQSARLVSAQADIIAAVAKATRDNAIWSRCKARWKAGV